VEPEKEEAQNPPPTPANERFELRSGAIYENLTGGNEPWTEFYLNGTQNLGERSSAYAGVRVTNRFGLADEEFSVGGYTPLGPDWTLNPYATGSPSHNILARWSAGANLNHALGNGWGVEAGFEHRDYNNTAVNIERLTAEKYFDDYRIAYTLALAQGSNTGSTASHALTFAYFYDERNSVNIALAAGQELESIAPGTVRRFDVKSINIWGTSWLSEDAAIQYGAGIESFQPAFTRRKLELGFRLQF
jgi:YaiO family outer membrane protein